MNKMKNKNILSQATQSGEGSNWAKQNAKVVKATGVNHYEMGEHKVTKDILEEAFTGSFSRYNSFFNGRN
jgi:hypothetical protein